MKHFNLITTLLLIFTFSITALAQTPEEQGKQIAVEAKKRDTGWNDNKSR